MATGAGSAAHPTRVLRHRRSQDMVAADGLQEDEQRNQHHAKLKHGPNGARAVVLDF